MIAAQKQLIGNADGVQERIDQVYREGKLKGDGEQFLQLKQDPKTSKGHHGCTSCHTCHSPASSHLSYIFISSWD